MSCILIDPVTPSLEPTTTPISVSTRTADPQSNSSPANTLVGVVVAVIVVMVLVIVSVILVVMCIRKRNLEWDLQRQTGTDKQTTVTVEDGREGFSNAVYSSKSNIMFVFLPK